MHKLNFKKKTEEDRIRSEQLREEAMEKTRESIAHAKECLADDKFLRYRKGYESVEKTLINQIINYQDNDPIRYAFEISKMCITLRNAKSLIGTVEQHARKKET